MIVTKNLWLSWPTAEQRKQDFNSEGVEQDFNSEWVDKEPKQHNGILVKGKQMNDPARETYINFPDNADFTLREFVNFIKDGTLVLEETDA